MSNYSSELIKFVNEESIKSFIDDNNWDDVYWAWEIRCDEVYFDNENKVAELTMLLLDAKIDFLKYMSYIPIACFKNLSLDKEDIYFDTIHISNKVVRIEERAFWNSEGIHAIYIPKSVERIDEDAFNKSKIKRIFYEGSLSDWKKIIDADNVDIEIQVYLGAFSFYNKL